MKHTRLPITTLSCASVVRERRQSGIKASTLICLDCVEYNKYGMRSQKKKEKEKSLAEQIPTR